MQTRYGEISLESIFEAYKRLGYKPAFGQWFTEIRGVRYTCPLVAYVIQHNGGTLPKNPFVRGINHKTLSEALDVPEKDLLNFTAGFDGLKWEWISSRKVDPVYELGYNIGQFFRGKELPKTV